jgi:predicted negative regulator of RcsB-dependent stress response
MARLFAKPQLHMSKYTRKQSQAKPQDEFVGFWDKLFHKAAPYANAIGITAATAAVLIAVVWGVSSYFERKSQGATETFGHAVKIYEADLLTDDNPVKSEEENPIPRFKTDKERATATLAELDSFDKKYGRSATAREARLFRAGVLFDQGRFDEAGKLYQQIIDEKGAAPLTLLAKEGLGLVDEQQGKLDDALKVYRELQPKTGDFFRDRALWDEARVLQKKGDKGQAAARLKELTEKMPTSPLKDEAQNLLAQLAP